MQSDYSLAKFNVLDEREILNDIFEIEKVERFDIEYTKLRNIEKKKYLTKILDGDIVIPFNRLSPRHLRYLSITELKSILLDYGKLKGEKVINKLLCMCDFIKNGLKNEDLYEATFIGIVLWLLSLDDYKYNLVSNSILFDVSRVKDMQEWYSKAKKISVKLKSIQNIVDIDLTDLFEMEVLLNRGFGELDWQVEKEHRSNTKYMNTINKTEVFKHAVDIFRMAEKNGDRPIRQDFDSFWKRRFEVSPTGSFHSQYEEDLMYRPKDIELRNKFVASMMMPTYKFEHFYNRNRETRAWPHVKYEWGKLRAIYGVDFTNFIMSTYAFEGAEKCVPSACPIGKKANGENINRIINFILQDSVPYCCDYTDFNITHSFDSMAAVLDAYVCVYANYLDPDQIKAAEWVRDAIYNSYVIDKNTGNIDYKTTGTLFSGWRLTAFMNTILNYIYKRIIMKNNILDSIHNGDDSFMGVKKLRDVIEFEKGCAKYNISIQRNKCFLSGINEFLRASRNNKDISQYLTRSIATIVHGTMESIVPNNLMAIFEAIKIRIDEYKNRKGNTDLADIIKNYQVKRVKYLWKIEDFDYDIFEKTHRMFGGLNDQILDMEEDTYKEYRVVGIYRSNDDTDQKVASLPGAFDYAQILTKYLFTIDMIPYLVHTINKAVYSFSKNVKWIIQEIEEWKTKVFNRTVAMYKYKCFHNDVDYGKARIAKMFGLPLIGLQHSITRVYHSLTQYSDMKYWAHKLL